MWGIVIVALAEAAPVQLHHQGRLVDAQGAAVNGVVPLIFTLHDSSSDPAALHTTTATVPVEQGFYTVTLPVDAALLGQDLWLQVASGSTVFGPRTPLLTVPRAAAVAGGPVEASRVELAPGGPVVLGHDTSATCSEEGALTYDPVSKQLKLCTGTTWTGVFNQVGVSSAFGTRRWADGTLATSCDGYRRPTGIYGYLGDTGDGVYRIQPPSASPMDVWCEMDADGGGWTLVLASANLAHLSGHYNDFWYTSAYQGTPLTTTPTSLVVHNGLVGNTSFGSTFRFTVDTNPSYSYVLAAGVWNGGTAEVNDPRFVRFNTGHSGQFWQGIATCSSGCHSALAVPTDGANTNNGYYAIWGHTNGPPTWGLSSDDGLDVWMR